MTQPGPLFALALHGGAGALRGRDYRRHEAHIAKVAEAARERLKAGEAALNVAAAAVRAMEESGLYVAGRGAGPNTDGEYELDAAIMDGAAQRAGAVAVLRGFRSPIDCARAVMERSPHVLLAGPGAAAFCRAQGLAEIADEAEWFAPASRARPAPTDAGHGTVGAVVRDAAGRLAAATSTGGVFGKLPGRVGDSPLIGAGTWADARVAVSCTGQGEYFIRACAAANLAARIRHGGQGLAEAADGALRDMAALGGSGGLIAVDASGATAAPFVSQGMIRATLRGDGPVETGVL